MLSHSLGAVGLAVCPSVRQNWASQTQTCFKGLVSLDPCEIFENMASVPVSFYLMHTPIAPNTTSVCAFVVSLIFFRSQLAGAMWNFFSLCFLFPAVISSMTFSGLTGTVVQFNMSTEGLLCLIVCLSIKLCSATCLIENQLVWE